MTKESLFAHLEKYQSFSEGWDGDCAIEFTPDVLSLCRAVINFLWAEGFENIDLIPDANGNVIVLVENANYVARFDVQNVNTIEYDLEINGFDYPTEYFGLDGVAHAASTLKARLSELCNSSERLAQDGGVEHEKNLTSSPSRQARLIVASPQSVFSVFRTDQPTYVPT